MVAVVGFAMIICIVALLLKGKMSPIVVLTVIPAVAALILGHGPVEIAEVLRQPPTMVFYLSSRLFISALCPIPECLM